MKILYVQDTDWIRRNPMQHNHLAERMVLRGHEVRVIDYEILWRKEGKKEFFSRKQVFQVSRLLQEANHTVIRPSILKIPILDYFSMLITYSKEIKRQINEFNPDIIIGDCILTPYLAFKASRKHGIPTVYYILDVSHRLIPYKFLQPLGKMIEKRNFTLASRVLVISKGLQEYAIKMGASPEKVQVLTTGANLEKFDPAIDGRRIREKYNIRQDDLVLIFVGWIHHFNGLKEVALELIKKNNEKIKLLVVGDGDGYQELQNISENYNQQNRIILTGRKPYDEIPSYIAAADICLFPSYPWELTVKMITPVKVYDYIAMRKPVISTRLPGITQEFGEDNGIIFIDKPEDTIEKAIEMAKNNSIRENGEKARQYAKKIGWDKITDIFERTLNELVQEYSK